MLSDRSQYRNYAFIILLLIASVISENRATAELKVENKRECTTCHITWLAEFKREYETPLISFDESISKDSGKHDASSTERMCFSCHDGFVLDSRFMWQDNSHNHPVGAKPTKDMHTPSANEKITYPLDNDGKVYCGTCHTAHGVDWKSNTSAIFMREENIDSSMCKSCHVDKPTGLSKGNHPTAVKLKGNLDKLIQSGAKVGRDNTVICETCHRPHGGLQEILLVSNNSESELCLTCHQAKASLLGSKHDMHIDKGINNNLDSKQSACSACHDTHNSSSHSLLSMSSTDSDHQSSQCLTCHSKGGAAEELMVGEHTHPIDIKPKNNETLKLPLFSKSGQPDKTGGGLVKCLTCHDPHGSTVARQPINQQGLDKPLITEKFLRVHQGKESKLCINCHQDKREILNSPHDITSKEENFNVCESCHSIHNANGAFLKSSLGQYPNMSVTEGWCRECHKENGIAAKSTVSGYSHPTGIKQEKRHSNSTLPLFDKMGNHRSGEGMVDCATCHDPHKWSSDETESENKLNSTSIEQSNSFLRISVRNDSKLCVACHLSNSLVIGTDHDMSVSSPDSVNIQGKNVHHSGVCGQCHLTHTVTNEPNLWAQKSVESLDINEEQCLSCHSENGIAKMKIPQRINHPKEILVWSDRYKDGIRQQLKPDVPVYNEEGEEHHAGFITCLSCHNPHQWDPSKNESGTGKNLEGNVLNSFLRNADSKHIICADCHGKDALYRYKYFHGDRAHTSDGVKQ